ncbi:chemotaxis protein CheC [Ruminiclostridium sufflavum DSM 19573]|uniref:Chemotaxis protein CheC n=1 Tax=Ruminiclostridium sufflavum DSM 19573 TaxID=1121337 RepID=A0A318XR85_9FIRM|nr:chemotaxis protein CheC [Ruminiclostridium sufflavum]PYG89843.1 chemotaxis protein CheC [Ruminiclostridium sufflavum DSM 19573]
MTISFEELNNLQLDVLKEIGNIGAGNAVTSLAKMLDKRVDMAVPKARILGFDKVTQILGGEEMLVVGILLNVTGDITGSIMFTMDINAARQLVNILFGNKDSSSLEFDELELSALKEIGNILTASYLSALAGLTNLKILPSVPELAIDMAGAILSVPAIEFGKVGDSVLYIETEFSEGITKVFGDFLLIPDVDSYEVLLKALGVIG